MKINGFSRDLLTLVGGLTQGQRTLENPGKKNK